MTGGGADAIDAAALIEAILFVSEEPVPVDQLAQVLEMSREDVNDAIDELSARLVRSGVELRHVGPGWRLYTRPAAAPYLERFSRAGAARLSQAALEVLAVVAYRQPVSRNQIANVRGVDSDSAVRTLERHGLIEEAGRLPLPGNPAVYRTTVSFLEKLGLESLADLPPLADHVPPASVVERLEETFRGES